MGELRVAMYCRGANAAQAEMDSQEKLLREYAAKNHYRNPRYGDNGYSGLRLDDRPGFRQLCDDIAAGRVDAVMVKDISRIGRRFQDVMFWLNGLEKLGVAVVAVNTPMQGLSGRGNDFLD